MNSELGMCPPNSVLIILASQLIRMDVPIFCTGCLVIIDFATPRASCLKNGVEFSCYPLNIYR